MVRRVSFALALASLVLGLLGGLARLGWLGALLVRISAAHGPLMVFGFFGGVIGLETAIANRERGAWVFALPLASVASGLAALVDLRVAGGAAVVAAFVFGVLRVLSRRGADRGRAIAVAIAWIAAALGFALTQRVAAAVPAWSAFLVLVILDERLGAIAERDPRAARSWFVHLVFAHLVLGAIGAPFVAALAARVRGAALVVAALWFLAHDARPNDEGALEAHVARARVFGYLALATGGVILVAFGPAEVGPHFDAVAHATFLGLAFSMIFAHAPRVIPRLVGIAFPFAGDLTIALLLLHGGLALRIFGDLGGGPSARAWGGLASALAIVVFFGSIAGRGLRSRSTADG